MAIEDSRSFSWRFRPTSIEWFCLALGSFLVFWYAWLMDDAYVYFRYVDNLVLHGQGLVWNAGEYVEGFSSPLWALLLVVLRFLRLNYWTLIRMVGVVSFIAFWWLVCLVNRALSPLGAADAKQVLNVPLVYLSMTYGVLCYFTSGLETPLICVAAALFAAAALWPRHRLFQILVGLTPLLRHEFILPFIVFVAYVGIRHRKLPWPGLLSCAFSLAAYGFFRIWYYANLLPNTFYLKDTAWLSQGFAYVYDTLIAYHTVPFLLAAAVLYGVMRKRCGDAVLQLRVRAVLWLLALPVLLYVIKIGGDPRHFRYLIFPYILIVLSSGGLLEAATREWTGEAITRVQALVLVFALLVFGFYPRQLQQHPVFRNKLHYRHLAYMLIKDASVHRYKRYTPEWTSSAPALSYSAAEARYAEGSTNRGITADWCCFNAYFKPAWFVVQDLGLCEPFLARTQMPATRPAHKPGLQPLARDIVALRARYGFQPGAFAETVRQRGPGHEWIEPNLPVINEIERKAYNQHNFIENMRLAFTPTGTIVPPSENGMPE